MKLPPNFPMTVAAGVGLAAIILLAPACSLPQAQVDTTRYFVLSSPVKSATPVEGAHARVALRPVQASSFLRGKSMQVRVGGNEISYSDEFRWAETLEAGVGRVLRDALEGRGGVAHVVSSMGEEHDYDVVVQLLRCEGDRDTGVARLSAVVDIFSTEPGAPRRAHETFRTEIPGWDRQNYGQLAQKLSEAVEALADRIGALVADFDKK